MAPPEAVLRQVASALAGPGKDPAPLRVEGSVGGGCIHPAVRLRGASGSSWFLKWGRGPGPFGFAQEARGLEALRAAEAVPVPVVGAASAGGDGTGGWLLLQWIEQGETNVRTGVSLGRGLARLHRPLEGAGPGWDEDGFIGSLPQANPRGLDWPDFWAAARIEPQWRRARESERIGRDAEAEADRLLDRMPEVLAGWEADGLCLLHGDLWSGNVLVDSGGQAHLIDPAAYRGHREVDLAMMELFGGFGGLTSPVPPTRGLEDTLAAYREAAPLAPGYESLRRPAYQLYPLLVHVNLFGGGYVGQALRAMRAVLAELG